MRKLNKPFSFCVELLGKEIIVTVTAKTISFRQKRSKQTLAMFWFDNLIGRYYKLTGGK